MNELSIPLHKLIAAMLWAVTGGLLMAGWLCYFAGLHDLAVMLTTLAAPTALGAATATARAWAMCVMRAVRASGGSFKLEADLRPVRD